MSPPDIFHGVGKTAYPLRLDAELRKLLEDTSAAEGTPMSQLIREGIEMRCANGGTPSSAALRTALAKLAEVAALLQDDGPAAVPAPSRGQPAAASPAGSWDDMLNGRELR